MSAEFPPAAVHSRGCRSWHCAKGRDCLSTCLTGDIFPYLRPGPGREPEHSCLVESPLWFSCHWVPFFFCLCSLLICRSHPVSVPWLYICVFNSWITRWLEIMYDLNTCLEHVLCREMASYVNFQRWHLMPLLDERVQRCTWGKITIPRVCEGEHMQYLVPDRKSVA